MTKNFIQKSSFTIAAFLAAWLLGANAARGQQYATPVQPWGYSFGVGTYESSVLEGTGKLLQGAGSYNLNTAQAIDTLEMARSKAIQNDRDALEARYSIKRANDLYRADKYAKERMSPELLSRVIKAKLPDPLSAAQYNRSTGELVWPSILKRAEFSSDRQAIEQALANKHKEDLYREVSKSTHRMHDKMLARLNKISTVDSVAARRFLRSVEFEARHLSEDRG